jgi:hypothetical protein
MLFYSERKYTLKFRFVFWDVLPTDVSEVRAASIIGAINMIIHRPDETSETSVNFNVTARRYITENCKLYTSRRENVKSHKICIFFGICSGFAVAYIITRFK